MLKLEKIQDSVRKYGEKYGAEKIYLFDSYARGEATEDQL
ncbi:nucleotidyltransferase domain-containing protein [Anaerovoracaceae bacterium 42-11]